MVTRPGWYGLRNGERAHIVEIKRDPCDGNLRFLAKGNVFIYKLCPDGVNRWTQDKYAIWHKYGSYEAVYESPLDIIAWLGEDI